MIIIKDIINNLIAELQQKIAKSSLLKGLFIIGSGTILAQGISIIISPILTRIFTPSDFGTFAVYASIFTIMIVAASFRYEFAIPLPKENYKAINLMILCFILLIFTSFTFFILFTFFKDVIISTFHLESIKDFLWLLIISFIGAGVYQTLNIWAVREREYLIITRTMINQNISGSFVKIILGFLKTGALGLIIGDIISKVTGITTLFMNMWRKEKEVILHNVSFTNIRLIAREYRHFPMFSFPASILNTIALQLPALMLSFMFGPTIVGWYSLAILVISIPSSLIASAMNQVYLGEICSVIHEERGGLLTLFRSTTKKLFLIALILIGIPSLLAPLVFPVLFGSIWMEAGWYCYPLAIMVIANFCISPPSNLPTYGFNHLQLIWDLTRTLSILSGFFIGMFFAFSPFKVLFIYGIIMAIFYYFLYHLNIYAIKHMKQFKEPG